MARENNYIGKQIGNYRIVEEIASGAFGHVYRGVHSILTRRIAAIKLLHRMYLGSQKERESFLQEAQLLDVLKHPNILPIYDVGIDDGIPYFIAEYAPNGSLRDRIKQQFPHPLPVDEAVTILTQVGAALKHAHQQNIIHRDLKPENILFNAKGEALLADFGIAVILSTPRTSPVDLIGSPLYMAPEQFDGMVSKRSDQYALACIAYEMLTGRNPFYGSSAVVMALKHKTETPVAPTQFNTYLPVPIERAILKAMSKERADRYPDIQAFLDAVHMFPVQKTKEQWLDEGNTLHNLQHYQEALQAYEQAIKLDANFADAHDARGDALYSLNRYQEALVAYERAIKLDPKYAHAYEGKGNVLYDLKRYQEALAAYERAIQLDAGSAAAYNGKGDALYYLNHYQEALLAYERAIQLDPTSANAHNGKSWTLWQFKRYEEALIAAQHAVRLDRTFASAYNGMGNAFYKLRRYSEALAAYEQAMQRDPNLVHVYNGKGQALWRLGRFEEALAAFERTLTLNPHFAFSYDGKGSVLRDLRRYREALECHERAIQLNPQFARAHFNKGIVLYDLKRYEEALGAYEQALHLEPQKAIYHFFKSRALRQLGRSEEAQKVYEKARQLGYTG
jgi:tetratricopeptide (TPR) repeat protein/tRNA A-37 threonylcarbamoyl transferase component Bud32